MATSIYFNRLASQKYENTILQTTLRGVLISWREFRKKIMKNICNIKVIQRKHTTKMNPSYHQSVSVKLIKMIM